VVHPCGCWLPARSAQLADREHKSEDQPQRNGELCRTSSLRDGGAIKLEPLTEAGSGSVHEKERAALREIIEKLNQLFTGQLTDDDQLVYVRNVILGKVLESKTLAQQASSNSAEQFADSPDLDSELLIAIMDVLDAHTIMSRQALDSPSVRRGIKDILLNHLGLWERLRAQPSP
jgi:type I restriction enzyme, R subunit